MGGAIAVNYASRQPQGLGAMVLSGPLINTAQWLKDNQRYRALLPEHIQVTLQHYEHMGDFDHPEFKRAVGFFYQRHLCRVIGWPLCLRTSIAKSNTKLYRHMWGPTEFIASGTLQSLDLVPLLTKIKTPTLFIAGDFDGGSPEANKRYAGLMYDAQTRVVYEASHTPHIENPRLFFSAVRRFLRTYD